MASGSREPEEEEEEGAKPMGQKSYSGNAKSRWSRSSWKRESYLDVGGSVFSSDPTSKQNSQSVS